MGYLAEIIYEIYTVHCVLRTKPHKFVKLLELKKLRIVLFSDADVLFLVLHEIYRCNICF